MWEGQKDRSVGERKTGVREKERDRGGRERDRKKEREKKKMKRGTVTGERKIEIGRETRVRKR